MNEADVEGIIVRPFCHALGYKQGDASALLRSQMPLRYPNRFLGRKKRTDPPLRGQPDFVCEIVGVTRWVIEAKSPRAALTQEDSEQAHSYAVHPDIAAEFYVLTNGREFRLYRFSEPKMPLMVWPASETSERFSALENILGPDAMRRRAAIKIDLGKPLAKGIGSEALIVGGFVEYMDTVYSPPRPEAPSEGYRATVTDGKVFRTSEGYITATVDVKFPFPEQDVLHRAIGLTPYVFHSPDSVISSNVDNPTLMQAYIVTRIPAGTTLPRTPITDRRQHPFDVGSESFAQALGYLDGDIFRGDMQIDYLNSEYEPGEAEPLWQFRIRQQAIFEIRIK